MKRGDQIRKISSYLAWFCADADNRAALNMNDISLDAEEVFKNVLSVAFDCKLIDLNTIRPNYPAVDLGDVDKGIAVQMTTNEKAGKIQKTVDAFFDEGQDKEFPRRLIVMVLSSKNYRITVTPKRPYPDCSKYPDEKPFSVKEHVLTTPKLMKKINTLDDKKVEKIFLYLREQFEEGECQWTEKGPLIRQTVPAGVDVFIENSRRENLDRLNSLLQQKKPVYLWGMAGMGKTQTAIQLGRMQPDISRIFMLPYIPPTAQREGMELTLGQAIFRGHETEDLSFERRLKLLEQNCDGAMLIIDEKFGGELEE